MFPGQDVETCPVGQGGVTVGSKLHFMPEARPAEVDGGTAIVVERHALDRPCIGRAVRSVAIGIVVHGWFLCQIEGWRPILSGAGLVQET